MRVPKKWVPQVSQLLRDLGIESTSDCLCCSVRIGVSPVCPRIVPRWVGLHEPSHRRLAMPKPEVIKPGFNVAFFTGELA
jgi:hypothetical protein